MKRKLALIVVNLITFIRLIGTFILPIISTKLKPESLITYIVLILATDTIDGVLARRLNASTIFGAILDALADKLFAISTLLIIASKYSIMYLPIITEVMIMLINTEGATRGAVVESSYLGKLKTWILGICLVVAFLTVYSLDFITVIRQDTIIGLKTLQFLTYLSNENTIMINNIAFIMVGADLMVSFDYINRVKRETKTVKQNGINIKNYQLKRGKELIDVLFNTEYYLKTKHQSLLLRLGKEVKNEKKIKRQ